jgi:hypothetical protein
LKTCEIPCQNAKDSFPGPIFVAAWLCKSLWKLQITGELMEISVGVDFVLIGS